MVPMLTLIMTFIPGGAAFTPIIPIVQGILKALTDVQAAWQANPQSVPDVLGAHLGNIGALISQAKSLFPTK